MLHALRKPKHPRMSKTNSPVTFAIFHCGSCTRYCPFCENEQSKLLQPWSRRPSSRLSTTIRRISTVHASLLLGPVLYPRWATIPFHLPAVCSTPSIGSQCLPARILLRAALVPARCTILSLKGAPSLDARIARYLWVVFPAPRPSFNRSSHPSLRFCEDNSVCCDFVGR